jgi:hypothetical protein
VVKPPPDRSDCHGRPKQATQRHGQTAPRIGPTTIRDGPTACTDGQTTPFQNRAPRMVKPRSSKARKWKVKDGRNKKPTFKPTFNYLLNKYTKAGPKDRAMKRPRSPIRQERREQSKQAKPKVKGKGITKDGYDPRISQPWQSTHPIGHPGASSSTGFLTNQMQWCPPPMMSTYPIWIHIAKSR